MSMLTCGYSNGGTQHRHSVTVSQVCLRWVLDRGCTIAVGTGSNPATAASYAKENLDLFGFALNADEIKTIDAIAPPSGTPAVTSTAAAAPGAISCIQMLSNGAGIGWSLKATLGAFCPGIVKALNGLAKLSGDDALYCLDFHDALGPESITGCLGASVAMNALGKFNDTSHMICDDLGLLVFREQADCIAGATTFNALLPPP